MLNNTAMKILNSSQVSAFGGLNFVLEELDRQGIGQILNDSLPVLSSQSRFDWRDLLYCFWSIYFCGGDCAEDLSANLGSGLRNMPRLNAPSPDRVLNRMKELAMDKAVFKAKRGHATHEMDFNNRLNALNLKVLKKLHPEGLHADVLDYDNTVLFTEKADAKRTYLKGTGYCPGVGLMGQHVVYVENRNGNSDAQTLQQDTLQRMFSVLQSEDIKVKAFRADSASYQFETLSVVNQHVDRFYVRARMSQSTARAIASITNWEEVNIGGQKLLRGETLFTPFKEAARRAGKQHLLREYRLIATKMPRADGQINVFTGEACNYSPLVTSDMEMERDEAVFFYNARGNAEREFDVLKNDFGWNHMPFSKLNENTVFLILTAMCRNIYAHIIQSFSRKFKALNPNFRIKKFIFRFICIPARWIRHARGHYLRMYGSIGIRT
jgi:hypothetical protein